MTVSKLLRSTVWLIASAAALGCGDSDPGGKGGGGGLGGAGGNGGELTGYEAYIETLRDCGFASKEGILPQAPSWFLDDRPMPHQDCSYTCLSEASCEELQKGLCQEEFDAFEDCENQCDPSFLCENEISIARMCDGIAECEGGWDEEGCALFQCTDGGELIAHLQCDGFGDCNDESDEEDCPSFDCGDGTSVSLVFHCDGELSCDNGADEEGCVTFDYQCGLQ